MSLGFQEKMKLKKVAAWSNLVGVAISPFVSGFTMAATGWVFGKAMGASVPLEWWAFMGASCCCLVQHLQTVFCPRLVWDEGSSQWMWGPVDPRSPSQPSPTDLVEEFLRRAGK